MAFLGDIETELRNLTFNDVVYLLNDHVWRVSFLHAKQRGEEKESCYFIPYKVPDGILSFGEIIKSYLSAVESDCGKKEGELFCGTRGENAKKFQKQPIGINTIDNIGKEIAQVLNSAKPEEYTGMCVCTSCQSYMLLCHLSL